MIHLRSIHMDLAGLPSQFPFSLPLVRSFPGLEFHAPVTFFVGENGSGKSTLLEALAAACKSPVIGGDDLDADPTLAHARGLALRLRLAWTRRSRRGFFLRAEDFFRFARRMASLAQEMDQAAEEAGQQYTGYARQLAQGSLRGQKREIEQRYGGEFDARSHGESFLTLFRSRMVPGGLYLLDEPETPLSPQRQLTLLSMMKEMTEEKECQFVVATHSPILMAYPGAAILNFDETPIREVAYEDLEHVRLTRDFLRAPERYLRRL